MEMKKLSLTFAFMILILASAAPAVLAKNFIIQNQSNPSQNYFVVNGTNGDVFALNNISASYFKGSGKYLTEINTSAINSSGVNYWTKSGSYLYYTGGNVGIGTTSPTLGKLQVAGNLAVGASGNNYGEFFIPSSGTWGWEGMGGSNLFQIGGGSTIGTNPFLTLNVVSGNVGIGATSPSSKLQVNGNVNLNNSLYVLNNGNVGIGYSNPSYLFQINPKTAGTSPLVLTNTSGSARAWFGLESTNSYQLVMQNGTGTTKVLLDTNGNSYLNGGNVGIGTTSPGQPLSVSSSATSNNFMATFLSPSVASGSYSEIDFGKAQSSAQAGTLGYVYSSTAANSFAYLSNYGDNGASGVGLVVRKGGNVGIGTTSPSYSVDVGGSTPVVNIQGSSGKLYVNNIAQNTGSLIKIGNNQNIFLNGSVGIGTTSPSYRLDINATSTPGAIVEAIGNRNLIGFRRADGGIVGAIGIGANNNMQVGLLGAAGTSLNITSNFNTYFTSPNTGKVTMNVDNYHGYIGVDMTPSYPLDVNGTVRATNFIGNGSGLYGINASNSNLLGGHPASFYMPLNHSVSGQFDFNGGWTNSGLSIIGGNIYAQQGYFYKINSLSVSTLTVNGSIIPPSGFDNQFDIGSSSLRWRNLYVGTNAIVSGAEAIGYTSPGTAKLAVNGNVGIGTTAPAQKLTVFGTGQVKSLVQSSGLSASPVEYNLIGANSNAQWAIGTNYAAAGGLNDSLYFYKLAGTTGTKIVIQDNGNVGIGTTSPFEKLQVSGNISTIVQGSGMVFAENAGTGKHYAQILSSVGEPAQNVGLAFYTTANAGTTLPERMRILGNGNVGIGTTSPGYLLEADGTVGIKAASPEIAMKFTGTGNENLVLLGQTINSNQAAFEIGTTPSYGGSYNYNFYHDDSKTYMIGNVGIGATSPLTPLEIYTSNPNILLHTSSTSGTITENITFGLHNLMSSNYTAVLKGGRDGTSYGTYLQFLTRPNTAGTSASPVMTLSSSQYVGIGTTSPGYTLDVNGNIHASGTIYGTVSGNINPGFTTGSVVYQGASGLAQDNANFFYDSTNHALGIGTTTPASSGSAKLAVNGNIDIITGNLGFGDGTAYVTRSSNDMLYQAPSGVHNFNSGELYVSSSGIGVGTTSVTNKLTVNGNALVGGPIGIGGNSAPTQIGSLTLGYSSSSGYSWIQSYSSQPLAINPVGNNVGIGTTTIGSKFQVNGNAAIGYSTSTGGPSNGLAVSGSVGIGVTNPATALQVNGNATIRAGPMSRIYMGGTSGDNFGIAYSSSYPNYGIFYLEGSPDIVALSPNGGGVSNPVLTASGSGNVGIGLTNPSQTLSVSGDLGFPTNKALTTPGYPVLANVASFGLQVASLKFGVATGGTTTPNFVVDNVGRVGIGTTNPQNKLNVIGDINATGNIIAGGSITYSGLTANRIVATDGSKNLVSTITAANLLSSVTGTTGTAGNLVFSAGPTFTGTVSIPSPFTLGGVSMTTTAARLNYLTSAGGTTGTTSSNIVFSASPTLTGNVYIATTNTSLSQGSGNSLQITTNSGYVQIGPQNGAWAHFTTDRPDFYFNKGLNSAGTDYTLSSYTGNNLILSTGGTARITALNSNGNVGIGTTAPSAKLEVSGPIGVGAPNANSVYTALSVNSITGNELNGGWDTGSGSLQLAHTGFGETTGILFNAYQKSSHQGSNTYLFTTGNTAYTFNGNAYNYGAGALEFEGNGGAWNFYSSPAEPSGSGINTNITWGTPVLSISRSGNGAFVGTVQGTQLISTISTGTSPLTVSSTTQVNNLNANYLQGHDASYFATAGSGVTSISNSDGSLTISPTTGAAVASLNVGHANTWSAIQTYNAIPAFNGGTSGSSAPFTVDSTYLVTNLNADLLDGQHGSYYASASSLGSYVPYTGATSDVNLGSHALTTTGALTAATLNTGQGANELYAMNQNVRTTDNPTFNEVITNRYGLYGTYNSAQVQGIWSIGSGYHINTTANNFGNTYGITYTYQPGSGQGIASVGGHQIDFVSNGVANAAIGLAGNAYFTTIDTGQGATEVYLMNQNVRTSDSPTFVRLTLTQATGTAPLTVSSTTQVNNLNANYLQGHDASYFATAGSGVTSISNSDGSLTISPTTGAAVASLNVGHANTWTAIQTYNAIPAFNGGTSGSTAPFTVDSTYLVTNLNADYLDGQHGSYYATVSSLGSYVPYTGATTNVDLNNKNFVNVAKLSVGSATASTGVAYFNGNVGIGTTAPVDPLHVLGYARFESTGNPGRYLEIQPGGVQIITGTNDLYIQPSGALRLQSGSTNNHIEIDNSSSVPIIWVNGTTSKVGIGTTTPLSTLSVGGAGGGGVGIYGTGSTVGVEGYTTASNGWGLYGVNTAAGVSSLGVKGVGGYVGVYGTSASYYGVYGIGVTGVLGSGSSYGVYSSGPMYGTSTITAGNYVESILAGSTALYAPNGGITVGSVSSTYPSYFGGSVGIGTSSPYSKLDVSGNISVYGSSGYNWFVGTDTGSGADNNWGFGVQHPGSNYFTYTNFYGSGDNTRGFEVINKNGNSIPFFVGGSGNVGIGTNSPGSKLAINVGNNGGISVLTGSSSYYPVFQLGRTAADFTIAVAAGSGQWASGSAAGDTILRTESTSDRMLLGTGGSYTLSINNGHVGIGTIQSTYQLQLSTDSAAKPSTGTWTVASDKRIKENITYLTNYTENLNWIKNFPNAITYNYNKLYYSNLTNITNYGFVAQDVQAYAPGMVVVSPNTLLTNGSKINLLSVNTNELDVRMLPALKGLINDTQTMHGNIAQLNTTLFGLKNSYTELNLTQIKMEQETASLKVQNDKLTGKVTALSSTVTSLNSTVISLNQTVEKLSSTLNKICTKDPQLCS